MDERERGGRKEDIDLKVELVEGVKVVLEKWRYRERVRERKKL